MISIQINSLFPHQVAALCQEINARFIHISTDCVFTGQRGNYTEQDRPDCEDLYGKSKWMGEVGPEEGLTLRSSIIGYELESKYGLLEWFLSQNHKIIKGFTRAIYSGFTTEVMADIIQDVIDHHHELYGLYQVSSDSISKYDLLSRINTRFDLKKIIQEDSTLVCDRSLNSSRFRKATGFKPVSWDEMIDRLAKEKSN